MIYIRILFLRLFIKNIKQVYEHNMLSQINSTKEEPRSNTTYTTNIINEKAYILAYTDPTVTTGKLIQIFTVSAIQYKTIWSISDKRLKYKLSSTRRLAASVLREWRENHQFSLLTFLYSSSYIFWVKISFYLYLTLHDFFLNS